MIDCFKEIKQNSKRCKECHNKYIKKTPQELSNIDINSKYEDSKELIRKRLSEFIRYIEQKTNKLKLLKNNYFINKSNTILLGQRIQELEKFIEQLILAWEKTLKENISHDQKSIDYFLKDIKPTS